MIQCWTEIEIPPHSVFWMKDILNPCALETPIVRVFRVDDTTDLEEFYAGAYEDGPTVFYTASRNLGNLRMDALTNGRAAIPRCSRFPAWQLAFGVHWLSYDADAILEDDLQFHPRSGAWGLTSHGRMQNAVQGVSFMRVGNIDTIQQCVPVVMSARNDWGL